MPQRAGKARAWAMVPEMADHVIMSCSNGAVIGPPEA